LLIGGGSGVAPLIAMLREHARSRSASPMRLIYSTRSPDQLYFATELSDHRDDIAILYTRAAPPGDDRPPHRISVTDLSEHGWPADANPTCYVCGPTPFVESVTNLVVAAGPPSGQPAGPKWSSSVSRSSSRQTGFYTGFHPDSGSWVAPGNATGAEFGKTCMLTGDYVAETRCQIDEFMRVRRSR